MGVPVPEAHRLYRGVLSPPQRIACPGESKAKLDSTQTFNDMTTSNDAGLSSIFRNQPLFPTFPTTTQPGRSSPNTGVAVISTSLPKGTPQSSSMQLNHSDPHATEVTASGHQQGELSTSDIQDVLLRLQDTHVQSSLQTLQQLLTMGKAARDEELQAAALKLLMALNNANVSQWTTSADTGNRKK